MRARPLQAWFRPRRMVALAALALTAAPAHAQQPASFDHAGLARRALEQHVRPGYGKLASSAANLSLTMSRFCAQQSASSRRTVDWAFDQLVDAWGSIDHIGFGPVTTDNRLERILFWPDRRGLGARQVSQALETRDPGVADPQTLAGKSVALQGLGALEIVLFSARTTEDGEGKAHRCVFAEAIAANLAHMTKAVADEWSAPDGFSRLWLTPGEMNPAFKTSAETTLELAKALDRGIERLRDEQIVGPLGLNAQRRKSPAIFNVSGRTMRAISAKAGGLLDLYTKGGIQQAILAFGPAAGPKQTEFRKDAGAVSAELRRVRTITLALVPQSRPFDDQKTAAWLIQTGFPLKNARFLASRLLHQTAGIPMGFTANDGD